MCYFQDEKKILLPNASESCCCCCFYQVLDFFFTFLWKSFKRSFYRLIDKSIPFPYHVVTIIMTLKVSQQGWKRKKKYSIWINKIVFIKHLSNVWSISRPRAFSSRCWEQLNAFYWPQSMASGNIILFLAPREYNYAGLLTHQWVLCVTFWSADL